VLNRRHLRIKVMQAIYAMHQSGSDDLAKEEKFLLTSAENILDLYLLLLSSLIELREKEEEFLEISSKKHLATAEEKNPNRKFVNNEVLLQLSKNKYLAEALDSRKIQNWKKNDDAIILLLQEVKNSNIYQEYMQSAKTGFEADKDFIADLFENVIATCSSLYNYIEDQKLTWIDDLPVVNTKILKDLRAISEGNLRMPSIYKDNDDRDFAVDLFRKTLLNENQFAKEYSEKTIGWDVDRVAEIDAIILKMAICEFLKFPSIPVKVTINEYLEISKEYSTPKSSVFLNGILDNLSKEFKENDKLRKSGRGLLE
jgi:N utilization substance protein B